MRRMETTVRERYTQADETLRCDSRKSRIGIARQPEQLGQIIASQTSGEQPRAGIVCPWMDQEIQQRSGVVNDVIYPPLPSSTRRPRLARTRTNVIKAPPLPTSSEKKSQKVERDAGTPQAEHGKFERQRANRSGKAKAPLRFDEPILVGRRRKGKFFSPATCFASGRECIHPVGAGSG